MTATPWAEADVYLMCTRIRHEIADWLDTLDDRQLAVPSLCDRWTVREVAGHLTAVVTTTNGALLRQAVRRRGHMHRANADLAIAEAQRPLLEMTSRLRAAAGTELRPPVVGARGPLTDLLVHEGDMRIPLGLPLRPDPRAATVALGFLAGSAPGFVPRRRLRGLRLVAVDGPDAWGSGVAVHGTMADLMLAVCGRRAALPGLSGPGASLLAERL